MAGRDVLARERMGVTETDGGVNAPTERYCVLLTLISMDCLSLVMDWWMGNCLIQRAE